MENQTQNASPAFASVEERFLMAILEIEQRPDSASRAYARMLRSAGVPLLQHLATEWDKAGSNVERLGDISMALANFCMFVIVSGASKVQPAHRREYAAMMLRDVEANLAVSPLEVGE